MDKKMDDLEELYRNSFQEFSVEPRDDLFEKIRTSLPETPSKVSFFVKYKYLLGGLNLAVIGLCCYLYWNTKDNINKPFEKIMPSSNSVIEEVNSKMSNSHSSLLGKKNEASYERANKKIEFKTLHPLEHEKLSVDEVKMDDQHSIENQIEVVEKSNEEIRPDNKEEMKGKKSASNFYEKYSQNYKDSLRDLFK